MKFPLKNGLTSFAIGGIIIATVTAIMVFTSEYFDSRQVASAFNILEACFWIVLAAAVWRRARKSIRPTQGNLFLASATFFAFGLSDFVEAKTGAWFHPWWLLVWKTTCVCVLLLCFFRYRESHVCKHSRNSTSQPS